MTPIKKDLKVSKINFSIVILKKNEKKNYIKRLVLY
jgi:hypothetical protein